MIHVVKYDIQTRSELNLREHWAARHRRATKQKQAVVWTMYEAVRAPGWKIYFPVYVTLTRIGPRALDPDNCACSFKHVQDAIASVLGVDDGDTKRVRWTYKQRKGMPGEYAVEAVFKCKGA